MRSNNTHIEKHITKVSTLAYLRTLLTTLLLLCVVNAWGKFQDFEIDLTKNPVGDLPAGVTQISYPQNGASFNGAQHGWCWYAIKFNVDGPVKITLGGCQYINPGYEGYVTDGNDNKLGDISNKTSNCYDADKTNNVGTYNYTGGEGKLIVYCGQYCPYIKVEKTAAPVDPTLTINKTSVNIFTPSYMSSNSASITLNGSNLTNGTYQVTQPNVTGLSISPTQFTVADGTVNQNFTISYTSDDIVASSTAGFTFATSDEDMSMTVNATYGKNLKRTIEQTTISEATTWDFTGIADANIQLQGGTNPAYNQEFVYATLSEVKNDASFNAAALKVTGQWAYYQGNAQVNTIKFTTTVPGTVEVTFHPGTSANRTLYINGITTGTSTSSAYVTGSATVDAGEVIISGKDDSGNAQSLRISKIVFTPSTPAPVFTTNLTESATLPADDVIELWVTATGATSYQWYTNTTASNEGGTPIEGETRSVLNFVPQTVGTHYIYVVATNEGGSTASNVMTVTATAPESIPDEPSYPLTAIWDFTKMAKDEVNIGSAGGSVASNVNGISITVPAGNGSKLWSRGTDAQFANGTKIRVPVFSKNDVVTIWSYPNYHKYSVRNDAADYDVEQYVANASEVSNGYIEIESTGDAYLYKISSLMQDPSLESADGYPKKVEWDFKNMAENDVNIGNSGGSVPSSVDGISLTVPAVSGGKLWSRSNGDAQFNKDTKIQVPVTSENDIVSVWSYKGYHNYTISGVPAQSDFEQHKASASEATAGYVEIVATNTAYLYYISVVQQSFAEPTRTFVDFKVDFRVKTSEEVPYTVFSPSTGLPEGVQIESTWNDAQHGAKAATITVTVDGPVKFTIGSCQHGGHSVTVTKEGESDPIATIDNNKGCENTATDINSATYGKFVTWNYNRKESATLTFTLNGYLPFFFAEQCDYIPPVTVTYYDSDGSTVLGTQTMDGGSALTEFAYGESNVNVPEGKKFRNWRIGSVTGSKFKLGTSVNTDVNLYAYVSDIETIGTGKKLELTQSDFYVEEHDIIKSAENYIVNGSHGWQITDETIIQFEVPGPVKIKLGQCVYPNNGSADYIIKNGDVEVGRAPAVVASGDGSETTIEYTGNEATTLTLTATGNSYVHFIEITPIVNEEFVFKTIDLDFTAGGNAEGVKNVLEGQGGADKDLYFTIANDGTISYSTDVNENANLVLKGKYHSTNYGICGSAQFSFRVTGPVTITMGTTDASGTVTIKNAANEKVGELNINGNKYQNDHNNVVSFTYKGGATTLTLTGGQYVPYIKVEEYTGPLVDDYTITFAKDEDVIGVVPSNITKDVNATMTIEPNNKLYKKGYTFVGWSNGATTYAPGDTYTFTKDETLTAVFRQNTLSIDDRNAALTISWDLSNKTGLSLGKDYYYVTQTEVTDGTTTETIDVAFKIVNGSITENNVWVKIPADTKFTLPSEPGAVITYQTYEQGGVTFSKEGELTETTTDDNSKYSYSYNVTGEGSTIDMTFTKDGYVKNLQVVLPAPEYPKTATWDFTSATTACTLAGKNQSSYASDIEGVNLSVSYDGGEFKPRANGGGGNDVQINAITTIKIPVVSTSDIITITNYSSDGNQNNATYSIGGVDNINLATKTYSPTADEVKEGWVVMQVTGSGYMKKFQVLQNKLAPIDPVTDGIYDRVVSNLAELQEALTAADGTNRFKIFVKNGTYDFGTTINTVVKSNVSLIGESTDGVIIKNTPAGEGLGNSATLKLTGSNIDIENLTIQCTATYSDTEKAERGVTLWDQGDNNIFRNLKLLGRQDTYYSNGAEGKKSYFENCYITGTVDYLCGSGNIWFEGCTFYNLERSSGDVIAAPSTYASETGYVFSNCTIDGAADQDGKYYFARGWQGSPALTMINTTLKIQPNSNKYTTDISQGLTNRFNEYTTENAPANITIENVIGGLGNNDATELITVEKPHINDGKLLWKSDTRAIAYYIYKGNDFVATVMSDGTVKQAKMRRAIADTYDMEYTIDDESAEWKVRAINAMGAVGPLSEPADDTPILTGYPKTATWDFKNASPSTITSVNIQKTTGTVASNLDGIELYVDATNNGKLSYRSSGDAQFNSGTIIRVPIKSKQDEVTVTSYPNYHYYTVSGQQASEDVTTCYPSDMDVYNGYVKIEATGSAYLYSISVTQQDPTRTFKDFKINFRTDPYTVVEPSTGVLPDGVEVVKGTWHDKQHGYDHVEINVPVDGPVKFTIGSCQFGYDASGIKVKDSEGNEVGVIKPQKACDNDDTYDVNDVFYYNSFKPTTLTFSYGGYFPYFIAEKCNFIPTCTIEYYDTNGNKIGETETVEGNSPLAFTHTSAEVTIPTGHKFRSWRYGSASGRKANEGDLVVSDIKLYARTTPIEVASEYMHYDYDLRQQSFEVEEHDILMADGCGWHDGQHGWSFTNTSTLEIQVGGATTIRLGTCVYSAEACKFELYNGSVKVGEAEAKDAIDGKIYEIRYRGEATTLQLRATNTAYLHTLEIIGGPRLNFINNTDAQGVAPEPVFGNQTTQKFHILNNYTLYKEGYTLMGWTDNETTYDLDRDYSFATDANLYPVFAENEIAITDADAAVTVRWVFDQSDANAAPKLNIATSGIYTKRATVNGKPLDMLMTINGNVTGATVKKNTNFVVPKVPGMIVRKKVADQDAVEETISGEGNTCTITQTSDDAIYEYIEVVYPVLPDIKCVNEIAGEKLIETEDPANAGTVTLSESTNKSTYNIGNRYLAGETVTITAQAEYGYYITGMKIGDTPLDTYASTEEVDGKTIKATATCTTTDGITNVTITYGRLDVYALHINNNVKDGGAITLTPHYDNFYKEDANGNITAYYTAGTNVEITAEPTVKYLIDYWSKNDEIVKEEDNTFTGNSISLTKAAAEENIIIYYTLGYKGKVIFTQGDAKGASDSEWVAKGWSVPIVPDPIEDYGFTIPTCYTMYWQSHSITGWTDLSLADYNALSDGEKAAHFYALGSEHSFSSNEQVITLTPIYEEIKASFFNRTNAPVFMFDFRTDEMAQRVNYGPNKKGYWATHIHVEALNGTETISQDRDSEIRFDTGAKGKIDNTFMGEWAAFGEGTILWVPSCPYGVITLACYNKINMDLDDNGNPTGTTLEGKLPTLDPTASDPENNLYVYKWTTHSAENYVPLVIGDDYSYYKYIRCDLPAASYLDLTVVNEDDAKGSVVINDIEQGIMNADESIRFKSGSSVSVTATRNFGYELDYWDVNGVHVNHETAGGYTATTSTDGKSYTLSLILNDHTTIVPVFKVKPTYYITYNTGKQAEGVAPFPQWVEGGQKFEVAKNTSMYIEGQTLKYWVDENGNEYHFGENITAPDHDVLLYPVFKPNAFSLLDVTTPTEVKWIFGPKLGAPSIAFEGNAGILVAQLKKSDDFIDLKIDLDAKSQSGGKFNNIGREDEWCQINGGSLLVFPTSKDCEIELKSYNDITNTEICGNHEYTAGHTVNKIYEGTESSQTINFKNDGQYYSHVAVTYKPQSVDRPELASLSWDDTPLSSADLSTLKTNKNITIEVPPSYDENSTHDDYLAPLLTATVADASKGSVEVTRASFGSPTATITLKSANGTITDVYTVNFTFAADGGGMTTTTTTATWQFTDGTYSGTFQNGSSKEPDHGEVQSDVAEVSLYVDCTSAGKFAMSNQYAQFNKGTVLTIPVASTEDVITVDTWDTGYVKNVTVGGTGYTEGNRVITHTATAAEVAAGGVEVVANDNSYLRSITALLHSETATTPQLEKIVFNGNEVENGSTVESPTNGRIALTFNHIMKETSALPTIRLADGTERPAKETLVAPQGKTLVFDFYGLPANATVTVTMPAGSFKNLYGVGYQEPVSLIIHAADHSTEIAHKPFDFVVGVDGTIDEAIVEANKASGSDRFYIFIPDGEYQLMGNDKTKPYINGGNPRIVDRYGNLRNELNGQEIDNGVTKVSRSNVSIIGQSREGTILFNEPEIEGISYTSTIYFPTNEKDGYLQDMTLRNNFPYLSSMAVQKEKGYGEQAARAVSLLDAGERNIYKNVTLDSWQDTYFSNSQGASDNRGYFEDCKLMGVVDFLCGDGDVWLERTDLVLRNREGNNIAASRQPASQRWGYVFNNCRILAEEGATLVRDGDYTLGRPWGGSAAITYLYTKMSVNPRGAGWQGMSGDKPVIRFHEYKTMDENGNYISLGTRTLAGAAPGKGSDDPILSDADAAKYTVTNVLGGGEGYNPQDYTEQRPEVSNISIDDNILRWDKDEEALCYFVFKREDNGHYKYVTNIVENELNLDEYGTGWYSVRSANQRGGLGPYSDPIEYIGLKHYDLELNNSINYTYENDAATYNGYTWSTICLPFRASAPQGSWQSDNTINDSEKIYVYAATEINATNKTITLKKVNHLEKNVGYVTFAKTNTESNKNVIYRFRGTSHEPELESILNGYAPEYVLSKDNSGTLIPSETPLNAANNNVNCYTLAYKDAFGIGFYRFNGVTLKPYRAWLDAEKVRFDDDSNSGSGASSAHIRFVFDEGDSPWDLVTDIEPDIISVNEKDVKIYDIMGRRIRKEMMLVGNIYIINGKKILVK